MVDPFTLWKHYLQSLKRPPEPTSGFTLPELIVSVLVAVLVLGFSLQLVVDLRRQFLIDRARTQVSQTLRAGMDLVGVDIRQAGEHVKDTILPVISVADNATQPGQVLVLQRKLTPVQLRLCQPVVGNQLIVAVDGAAAGTVPAICNNPTKAASGLPIELQSWQNFRCNNDEDNLTACTRTTPLGSASACEQKGGSDTACVWAYIHDPSNGRGDFFLTDLEVVSGNTYALNRVDGSTWTNPSNYSAIDLNNPPPIYILEEREYRLIEDTNTVRNDDYALQVTINRQSDNIQRLVNQIDNFQVDVVLPAGVSALPFNFVGTTPTYITDWTPVENLRVTLTAVNYPDAPSNKPLNPANQIKVPANNLTLVSQFLPRNALSNPN